MADERGAWRSYGEKTIYDNLWVRMGLVDVKAPNRERFDYHVVHFGRIAIAMIVNDENDTVLMLWRYRFATDQWGYELLGGLVEDGEEPAATAAREAVEESGWAPTGDPEKLISFEPLPGNVTAPIDVFLWRNAERVGEPNDTEEVGRLEWVSLARITDLAHRGELLGSGAAVPLLYYLARRETVYGEAAPWTAGPLPRRCVEATRMSSSSWARVASREVVEFVLDTVRVSARS